MKILGVETFHNIWLLVTFINDNKQMASYTLNLKYNFLI